MTAMQSEYQMRFVFSKLFYALLAVGFVPLSLSWNRPMLRWVTLTYDLGLIALAIFDATNSKMPARVRIERHFGGRFAVGAETEVRVEIANRLTRDISLIVKDEYPPQMSLSGAREARLDVEAQTTAALVYGLTPPKRGRFEFGLVAVRYLSRYGLVWTQTRVGTPDAVKVYPNMRRAREVELRALGARSFVASRRKSQWRGEGRDFESLRDYVRGDEMRHISWTATARRGKLVTRQYQMERDQTILIALDAGRLMTARIENETKLDSAVHAALALMSAAARAGDNAGLLVFSRRIQAYLPPKRGAEHLDAALEALHLKVDLMGKEYVAEGLLEAFGPYSLAGQRVLLPRAAAARDLVPAELTRRGAQVDVVEAYRTVVPESTAGRAAEVAGADCVTFTSSSTVRNFVAAFGAAALDGAQVASIGPVTTRTARELGVTVAAEAKVFTMEGLVASVLGLYTNAVS